MRLKRRRISRRYSKLLKAVPDSYDVLKEYVKAQCYKISPFLSYSIMAPMKSVSLIKTTQLALVLYYHLRFLLILVH